MRKTWAWITLVGMLILCLALVDRSCKDPSDEYWIAREVYDADVAQQQELLEEARILLTERDQIIAERDIELSAGNARIQELERSSRTQARTGRTLAEENSRLKRDAAAAIAANPAVRALIDSYDLRCANYETQIFTLEKKLDEIGIPVAAGENPETGETIWAYPEGSVTGNLQAKYVAAAEQRDIWKEAFDQEHALRLSGDELRLGLEKEWKRSKFWSAVGKYGPPITFALGLILGK